MERELISVIIPVYRVEAYLEKCVDSVLAQTYPDLEIILVDDGSPDKCPAMCDAFAARDSRVRVLHRANGGLSAARNTGLDAASGRYVGFVDSDDYIAPDMYGKLYAALRATGADMSICGYECVDEAENAVMPLPPLREETLGPDELFERVETAQGKGRYATAVNRLYKRELFEGLRFREGKLYEDEFLAPHVIARCAAVTVVPEALYFYVQRSGSIMNAAVTVRRLDAVEAFMERYGFYRDRGLNALAPIVLGRAYNVLWQIVTHVDARRYRKVLRPWVKRVGTALLRHWKSGGLLLPARYALETLRSGGEKR